MAAFSHQYCPFLLDSVFLPNTPQTLIHDQSINYIPQIHDSTTTTNNNSLDTSVHASIVNHETSNSHLPQKQTTDQSSVVVDSNLDTSNDQVSQRVNNMVNPSKNFKRKINNSTASSLISSDHSMVDGGKGKGKKQKKCITEAEEKKSDNKKKKVNESEPPTGYIHVRARRGQATDSHSLAERVRREKISERMKTLQRLVPGCDKVTGKALMLDEIINYVQSLQNQVEFLSMKLASVSPFFYDFGMGFDALMMVRPTETTAFGGDDHHTITNPTITSNSITTNINIFPTPNSCQVLDSSSSLLFHGHRPTTDLMEGRNSALWEVEEPRQKFLSPSGFGTHLCSFQ